MSFTIVYTLAVLASFIDIDNHIVTVTTGTVSVHRTLDECRAAERQRNIALLRNLEPGISGRAVCIPIRVYAKDS